MLLWHLMPANASSEPWASYDVCFSMVIRATDEFAARVVAAENAGEEGKQVWVDKDVTHCVRLLNEGAPGLVIRDFLNG